MSLNPSAGSPPLPVPSRPRSKVPFLLGCGLLFVLVGGGCVALFLGGSRSVGDAKAPAGQFLVALEKADYKTAHQLLTQETAASTSAIAMSDIMALLQKQHGKIVGHTGPEGFNVSSYNGVTSVRLNYVEKFERGQTKVELTLTPENKLWKVNGFHFQL